VGARRLRADRALVWGLALLGLGSAGPAPGAARDANGAARLAGARYLRQQLALPLVVYALSLIATPMLVERYLRSACRSPAFCRRGLRRAALAGGARW
jgi:hypothetical protein